MMMKSHALRKSGFIKQNIAYVEIDTISYGIQAYSRY